MLLKNLKLSCQQKTTNLTGNLWKTISNHYPTQNHYDNPKTNRKGFKRGFAV